MKKNLLVRKIISTLLIFTLAISNSCIITNAGSTEYDTEEITKELVQFNDNWVIFKCTDSEGLPWFSINYDNKPIEDYLSEGARLDYRIIIKENYYYDDSDDYDIEFYWKTFEENSIKTEIEKYKYPMYIQFKLTDSNYNVLSISDTLLLYSEKSLETVSLLSTDHKYFEIYDLEDYPGKFRISLKYDEALEQTGNLSVSATCNYTVCNAYVQNHPVSNVTFTNYSNAYVDENLITYNKNYCIVSFDVDLPGLVHNYEDPFVGFMYYIFTINGLKELDSDRKPEDFQFVARTIVEYGAPEYEIPTEPTTTNNQEETTTKPEPTTTKIVETTKPLQGTKKPVPKKVLIKKIKLKAKKTVKAGKKLTIKVTLTPKKVTNKKLKWSVSNKKYAKISSKGVLTAKKAGIGKTVTVTAKAKDGSKKTAKIKIKIKK